jgi:hypothetical protein
METLQRHLIAIGGITLNKRSGERSGYLYSAFIVGQPNSMYLITAGHNLKNYRAAKANADIQIESTWLIDYVNNSAVHKIPIPFSIFDCKNFCIDKHGLDIAVIKLDYLQSKALLGNNNVPYDYSSSNKRALVEYDLFGVLGFPEEYNGKIENNSFGMRPSFSPFALINNFHDYHVDLSEITIDVIGGKLLDENYPKSMKGTSGGPVFALKKLDFGIEYALIGVQAMWFPSPRIVIATSFQTFIQELLAAIVKEEA